MGLHTAPDQIPAASAITKIWDLPALTQVRVLSLSLFLFLELFKELGKTISCRSNHCLRDLPHCFLGAPNKPSVAVLLECKLLSSSHLVAPKINALHCLARQWSWSRTFSQLCGLLVEQVAWSETTWKHRWFDLLCLCCPHENPNEVICVVPNSHTPACPLLNPRPHYSYSNSVVGQPIGPRENVLPALQQGFKKIRSFCAQHNQSKNQITFMIKTSSHHPSE